MPACTRERGLEALGEEVVILEIAEHPQVQGHGERDEELALVRGFYAIDGQPARVVHRRREDQERQESGIPASIEVVARRQEQHRLRLVRQHPVNGQQNDEEIREVERIKQHATPSSLRTVPARLASSVWRFRVTPRNDLPLSASQRVKLLKNRQVNAKEPTRPGIDSRVAQRYAPANNPGRVAAPKVFLLQGRSMSRDAFRRAFS